MVVSSYILFFLEISSILCPLSPWHRPGSRGSRFCTGPDAMPPAGKAYAGTKTVLFFPPVILLQQKELFNQRNAASGVGQVPPYLENLVVRQCLHMSPPPVDSIVSPSICNSKYFVSILCICFTVIWQRDINQHKKERRDANMELRVLRYFLAVAREGNITGAANFPAPVSA